MPIIEVVDLFKMYGDKVAVDGVSFTVAEGEILGILGPNGAGKTTTVECVEGLRTPDRGAIRVLGLDPGQDTAELRQRLGVQLQESELPDRLRVWEALDMYASFYRKPADWRALIDDWGFGPNRNAFFGQLSGGQKKRLFILLALVGNPEIVVFDELTAALDPQARRDTWELVERIRDRGVTVLLVTHFMDEAERLCDRIAVIDSGRIVAVDTPAGLIGSVDTAHRVTFESSDAWSNDLLTMLPQVKSVERRGGRVSVSGTGNLVYAVIAALARHDIVVTDVTMERANLEDAFVALTGRKISV